MDDTAQPLSHDSGAADGFEVDSAMPPETLASLHAALRKNISEILPETDLLVPFALYRTGRKEHLSILEIERVEAALPTLSRLCREHPFLDDVVRDIATQAEEFEMFWAADVMTAKRAQSVDRPAVRPIWGQTGNAWIWRLGGFAAAAVVVLAMVFLFGDRSEQVVLTGNTESPTVLTLEDGSTVRLMQGAYLTYDQTRDQQFGRSLQLFGDAYFVVAPDNGRPFTVQTTDMTVTVVGTRFGIARGQGGSEVVLASGEVRVSSNAQPESAVVLQPGMMSRMMETGTVSEPVQVDVVDALGWTGLFVFRGETYARIAEHLSRHYGVPVSPSPEIALEKQSGTFEKSLTLQEILSTLQRSGGLTINGDETSGFALDRAP
jgi:ferric-dicitrate binding protein FerR (iron transport regulator)